MIRGLLLRCAPRNDVFSLFLVSIFLLVACAVPYRGELPELGLTDPVKIDYELLKFKMDDGFWTQGYALRMQNEMYTVDSMLPVLGKVSPNALALAQSAQGWRTVQWVSLVGSLGSLAAFLIGYNDTGLRNAFAISTIAFSGVSIGAGFFVAGRLSHAASVFNEDFRRHYKRDRQALVPTLELGVTF